MLALKQTKNKQKNKKDLNASFTTWTRKQNKLNPKPEEGLANCT